MFYVCQYVYLYHFLVLYRFLVFLKTARILTERSRRTLRSLKRISPKKHVRIDWTREEEAALVQFIALHGVVKDAGHQQKLRNTMNKPVNLSGGNLPCNNKIDYYQLQQISK